MVQLIAILSLAVIASLLLGMLLGKMSERDALQERVDEAYNLAKTEAEAEKASFSLQLSEELNKVRQGIVQSVEAYDSVVRLVEERLPQPSTQTLLRLENPLAEHLLIPFRGQGLDENVLSDASQDSLNSASPNTTFSENENELSDSDSPNAESLDKKTNSQTIELRQEIQKETLPSEQADKNLAFAERFKKESEKLDRKVVN